MGDGLSMFNLQFDPPWVTDGGNGSNNSNSSNTSAMRRSAFDDAEESEAPEGDAANMTVCDHNPI